MKLDGVLNEGIAPHPVPLPMGEGTVRHPPSDILGSLLPGGEGQDEGSELRFGRDLASGNTYVTARSCAGMTLPEHPRGLR